MKNSKVETAPKNEDKKRIEELEIQLKTALSDFQNMKRDMEKRLEFERLLVKSDLLKSVICLADDIDLAMDNAKEEKGWKEGLTIILEKFKKTIGEMGAEVIAVKDGDKFDASVHEAVGVVDGEKEGTIAKVLQNGYRMGEVIIRPARVLVIKHQVKK